MGEIIRRTKNGKFLGFYLRFYENGRRRVLASKQPSHVQARRMLIEIEARIARGEAGLIDRRTVWPTVAELVERFLAEYNRPRVKDLDRYRAQARSVLQKALPHVGSRSVKDIKQSDIIKLRDTLGKTRAAGTVYNLLATLSAVFSWAMRVELCSSNPCKGVERPRAEATLDFLSREEVRQLLAAAAAGATTPRGRMLQVALALAVHTGLRKGELFGLRWIDVDLETRRLTVARSYRGTPKSGKARHLRLPRALVPLLRSHAAHGARSPVGLILPLGRNDERAAGRDAMLGLPRLFSTLGLRRVLHPWHLLRHTFASHFVMAGGNILALQKILGHANIQMTMIYAHLSPDFLGDEMDRVEF